MTKIKCKDKIMYAIKFQSGFWLEYEFNHKISTINLFKTKVEARQAIRRYIDDEIIERGVEICEVKIGEVK